MRARRPIQYRLPHEFGKLSCRGASSMPVQLLRAPAVLVVFLTATAFSAHRSTTAWSAGRMAANASA